MNDMLEFFKWLPQGGAAGAVILVVWLFLKQQDKVNALATAMSEKFTDAIDAYQSKSDAKLEAMMVRHQEQYARMQDQMTGIMKDQIIVNTRLTDAVTGLQHTVAALEQRRN